MSEQNKVIFISEEYSISNSFAELNESTLYKKLTFNESQETEKDGFSKIDIQNEQNKNESLNEARLDTHSLCNLTKFGSFGSLCLKSCKIKDSFDLLRCSSLGKNENLQLRKLPIESYFKHFKLSFESKQTNSNNKPYFSSSCVQIPFTIELTNKLDIPPLISLSEPQQNSDSINKKTFLNSVEISFEKTNSSRPIGNSDPNVLNESVTFDDINNKNTTKEIKGLNIIVLVAIDFGTTHSGYAYAFVKNPAEIHLMKRWSDGENDLTHFKIPTTILLNPSGEFHSFGYEAIEFYNDLESNVANDWNYFEKFKMSLHNSQTLNRNTTIKATNGKEFSALKIFSLSLSWFKESVLKELNSQSDEKFLNENIKWVITVPAIWKQPAKSFMREAACQASMITKENPEQLIIALEPEAASIYIRKLQIYQLVLKKADESDLNATNNDQSEPKLVGSTMISGTRYVVVDCGGGTIDVTIHEINESDSSGYLKELYKASGGPFGSMVVDLEFENLLKNIFSIYFIEEYKKHFPASFNSLMSAFECKKRRLCALSTSYFNISLPFSFIDFYKRKIGEKIETTIRKYNKEYVKDKSETIFWSTQGMLRLSNSTLKKLFEPAIDGICGIIDRVLNNPYVKNVEYLFLVGGFAESTFLQQAIQAKYVSNFKIIIPRDVSSCVLKGAVMYGLNPSIIRIRRSPLTYGICALRRFDPDKHLIENKVTKNGIDWCVNCFDKFVVTDQQIFTNETFMRRYAALNNYDQTQINIDFYCSESDTSQYVNSDATIKKCATIILHLTKLENASNLIDSPREIQIRMAFGETEIKLFALDLATNKCVNSSIEFLDNES